MRLTGTSAYAKAFSLRDDHRAYWDTGGLVDRGCVWSNEGDGGGWQSMASLGVEAGKRGPAWAYIDVVEGVIAS